jgi:GH15 family glucan-1,4-alpha-glucosidase
MASRIEDYGLIGNTRTAALVSKSGSIDWLCLPDFDSDACLASLVGFDEHGTWSIAPTVAVRARTQRYRGDTLILETLVECDGGAVQLTELMPIGSPDVIRIVECVEGEVPMEMRLFARFGYGAYKPWTTKSERGFRLVAGPDALIVAGDVEMRADDRGIVSYFTMKKGDRRSFRLSWFASRDADPKPMSDDDIDDAVDRCDSFWQEWSGRCTYQGEWRNEVLRSLITLKGMTYAPTGAIVAAPTLGLPEELGGVRNWDYRFCWVRDASMTLHALMLGGYIDEATAFRDWLLRAAAGDSRNLQIMYAIDGRRRLTEVELPWLPGYESSRPVRAGNAAHDQFQLDVYGEVIAATYQARQMGLAPREDAFDAARELMQFVASAWQRPDDGIWEVRGGRRHFTYSKVMAWVAIDRCVKLLEQNHRKGAPLAPDIIPYLHGLRARIHEEVCALGFNPKVNAFTQSYGGEALDASVLLIPRVGFLPADDPRVIGTVAAVEKELLVDGFVLRYRTEGGVDGLPGTEGAFLPCSFWLADNYALQGRIEEAEELFTRLVSLCNPLGLLAEEYDAPRRRLIGNFPQAFSHLALISSVHTLSLAKGTAHEIAGELSFEVAAHAAH